MLLLIGVVLLVLLLWAFERYYLRGGKLDDFDPAADPEASVSFARPEGPGPEHHEVTREVTDLTRQISRAVAGHRLQTARDVINGISDGQTFVSEFIPADAGGVPAEWVLAPEADETSRVLYIHGGGFIMGSPRSHRAITSRFSEVTGSAVLAIDYRLMPEHRHADCVEDCRTAFNWILENGPNGPGQAERVYIGGDSAGGNLALSLSAWIRDHGLRAPDAVVALSPLTDASFSGASLRDNEASDVMLAPMLRVVNRLSPPLKSWLVLWKHKLRPASPLASPLFGDLSGLPPTLVQASEAEMLLDDARRYVYKARAQGSPVRLQTWADVVHVWQIFYPRLPQAGEAWEEIGRFIRRQSRPGTVGKGAAEEISSD